MSSRSRFAVAVIGVGAQGSEIVDLLCDLGHEVVGAVDVGAKVGRPLTSVTASVPELTIRATIEEVLQEVSTPPDIVVIAASIEVEQVLLLAGDLLGRGINVITLHSDAFVRDEKWAGPLRERAIAGGASFLATGVQDTWWVQLPALVASSSVGIETIRVTSALSLDQISPGIGDKIGIGLSAEEFPRRAAEVLNSPAILGGPLLEAARRMGATPGAVVRDVQPVFREEDYLWESAGRLLPVGTVAGSRETIAFDTAEGIRFEGTIEVLPISRMETGDELHVIGIPEHHLYYRPFPGHEITNASLVARIPDVIAANPGVLFAAEMPPASHQFPQPRA